jgi:hypothetical protein
MRHRTAMRNLFWHTVTSFTKAKIDGYGGITDALLEFDRYKVWEETGDWINEGMLKSTADNFLIPENFRKGATFDENDSQPRAGQHSTRSDGNFPLVPKRSSGLERRWGRPVTSFAERLRKV